jgi:hypothetical protein
MTAWNDFVKKIYHEGHNKDSSYQFKQALKDASKRKSEMGSSSSSSVSSKKMSRKSKKACMKSCKKRCRSGRKMKGGMNCASKMEGMEGKVGGTRRRRRK